MKLRPIKDKIVVRELEDLNNVTKGGIQLIKNDKNESLRYAEVIAVGPGKTLKNGEHQKMQVSVGETVLFNSFTREEYKEGGEDYIILTEKDIISVFIDPPVDMFSPRMARGLKK